MVEAAYTQAISHRLVSHPCPCLMSQLAYNAITKLRPKNPTDPPFIVEGLAGFEREYIRRFLLGCPIKADGAAIRPAEQPAPHPIVVDRAFQQCQVRLGM